LKEGREVALSLEACDDDVLSNLTPALLTIKYCGFPLWCM